MSIWTNYPQCMRDVCVVYARCIRAYQHCARAIRVSMQTLWVPCVLGVRLHVFLRVVCTLCLLCRPRCSVKPPHPTLKRRLYLENPLRACLSAYLGLFSPLFMGFPRFIKNQYSRFSPVFLSLKGQPVFYRSLTTLKAL